MLYIAAATKDVAVLSPDNMRSETTTLDGEIANGLTTAGAMAGDAGSPNRQWGVSPAPYGNSTMQYTEDGWGTSRWVVLLDHDRPCAPSVRPGFDFARSASGTVLAAGNGNFVIHSTNGRNFWWNGADGAGTDWRAVALASGTQGAIGGAGGRLALTTQASALPIPVVTPPVVPPFTPPVTRTPTRRPGSSSGTGGSSDTPPNVSGRPETHTTGGATLSGVEEESPSAKAASCRCACRPEARAASSSRSAERRDRAHAWRWREPD